MNIIAVWVWVEYLLVASTQLAGILAPLGSKQFVSFCRMLHREDMGRLKWRRWEDFFMSILKKRCKSLRLKCFPSRRCEGWGPFHPTLFKRQHLLLFIQKTRNIPFKTKTRDSKGRGAQKWKCFLATRSRSRWELNLLFQLLVPIPFLAELLTREGKRWRGGNTWASMLFEWNE